MISILAGVPVVPVLTIERLADAVPLARAFSHFLNLAVWLHLAQCKGGKDGAEALKEFAEKRLKKDEEKHRVAQVRMYLGQITPEQYIKTAVHKNAHFDKGRKCEAQYHIGEYWMLKNQPAKARESFQKCLATRRKDLYEYGFARAILKKLDEKKAKK